jgi:hypothetical protein
MGMDRLTLLDIAKQQDPDGKAAQIVEVLNQTNAIVQDAPAYAANAPMGNRVTLRSSLPVVNFAKVNQGVVRSKGSTEQKVDTIGLIAGLSEVDSKLQKIVGAANFDKARWNEDQGFLESMSQLAAQTFLYGDERVNEAAFTGFATRMGSLQNAITGPQVVNYGSVTGGDGTSIYIVDWGERACSLIYPEASIAGIDSRDKGELRVTDADNNPMMAYVTAYDWTLGLTVRDPRHMGRLANIDVSDAQADTNFKLGTSLIDVLTSMPDPGGATRVMYCHRFIFAAFYKQAINKQNAALRIDDYKGKPTPYFWDIPIRRCDQIVTNESTVS